MPKLLVVGVDDGFGVDHRGLGCDFGRSVLAGQVYQEGRDFKRHFLVLGNCAAFGLRLEQRELIVPRFDFDAAAERQCRCCGGAQFCGGGPDGNRVGKSPVGWYAVAQMRADQIRNFLSAALQRLEKCLRRSGLIDVW